MIYVDTNGYVMGPTLKPGFASETINRLFGNLRIAGERNYADFGGDLAESSNTNLERRLEDIQRTISSASMHFPNGFATGLRRQFANLLDEDAWEEEDELPGTLAVSTFLRVLYQTAKSRRPGIGANGRGSISAFWTNGDNRLTVECLPGDRTTWVLTRVYDNGETERAAGECSSDRLNEVIGPYSPEVWFDQ